MYLPPHVVAEEKSEPKEVKEFLLQLLPLLDQAERHACRHNGRHGGLFVAGEIRKVSDRIITRVESVTNPQAAPLNPTPVAPSPKQDHPHTHNVPGIPGVLPCAACDIEELQDELSAKREEHSEFWDTALSESVGLRYNYEYKTLTNERAELAESALAAERKHVDDCKATYDLNLQTLQANHDIARREWEKDMRDLGKHVDEAVKWLNHLTDKPKFVEYALTALLAAKEGRIA